MQNRSLHKRFWHLEHRADVQGRKLVGDAARYNEKTDYGGMIEMIMPGAFADSLTADMPDILCLLDHKPDALMGRTSSGTLKLSDRTDGLGFELSVPDTNAGRDALVLAQRGDLGGASIGFRIIDEAKDGQMRIIKKAELVEISIISSFAAYEGTKVEARHQQNNVGLTPKRSQLRRFLETL